MITYDIETVKNAKADEYYTLHYKVKPGNRKDPEKIKEYEFQEREKALRKAGLYWWTGQIISICAYSHITGDKFQMIEDNEASLLKLFFAFLDKNAETGQDAWSFDLPPMIGKNAVDFDAPYIVGRCLATQTPVHPLFRNKRIEDIDHIFSKSRSCAQVTSLANYAWGLEIRGKDTDGSKVQGMYDLGQKDSILKYCWQDVEIVNEIVRRYELPYIPLCGGR